MKKQFLTLLVFGLLILAGCGKEKSFETGNNPSDGSLQSDATGDCLPKTVNGAYVANTALVSTSNTLNVDVNVTKTGTYLVYTDTVNGYFFRSSGVFTQTGTTTVTLRGNGTPFAAGVNNFVVNFDSTQCDIAVTVLPAGTGAAVFTLAGAGGSCTGANIQGTYALGVALTSSNTVAITANVTQVGTYTVTTTYQGMTFSATGAFTNTGTSTVTLVGSGTPTTGGANVVPVTVGTSTCSFTINVNAPASGTLTCGSLAVQGTYTAGTAVTTANSVSIPVNFTSTGPFTITSNTVDGFNFSVSGNAAATGTQTITVLAVGTPASAGVKNFTLSLNGSSTGTCSFSVTVQPGGGGGPAQGVLGGAPNACTPATVNGVYYNGTAVGGSNTVQISITVATAGTYTISSNTVGGVSFSGTGNVATGAQNVTLNASGTPNTTGPQVFTLTWGTSTCTFVVNFLSSDYFPRTTNSNWSYEDDDDANDSLYRYVIAGTHSANGNTYNIFLGRNGVAPDPDSTGYYRKSGGDYIEWINMAGYIGFDPPAQWSDYIILKDNVAVGTEWTTPGFTGILQGQSYTVRLRYKIHQKDVPITLTTSTGTATYQNVIVVMEEADVLIGGNWISLTTQGGHGKSYYARGIGLIMFEAYDENNVIQYKQELRRYQVF